MCGKIAGRVCNKYFGIDIFVDIMFFERLIKHGGIISADFCYNPESIDGVRRRCAADSLNEDHPGSLFHGTSGKEIK